MTMPASSASDPYGAIAEVATDEARLAAIVKSSTDAVYSRDAGGLIRTWNPAAERLYGYAAHEIIGRPVSTLVPDGAKAEERLIHRRVFSGERLEHYDADRVRKDGSIVNVEITVSPIFDDHGRVIEASTVARDVTERKRAEALTARFVANAAHELRTPLTALSALASALARRWDTMGVDHRRELFDAMERQGERARLLVNNLLELSQLESGRLKVDPVPIDAAEAAERAAELAPPPDGVSLDVSVREARGVPAWADPLRLQQVLTNLLTNAYKYGGPNVRVEARDDELGVQLAVADDGPGLPEELIAVAFEPFTRGGKTGSAAGSGLGLAICRATLEAFGGTISYEPEPSGGARFVVTLSPPQ